MKCAILFALVAFTSATPLSRWGRVGSYPSEEKWNLWGHEMPQNDMARQMFGHESQEDIQDRLQHTHEAIRNLHWQLQQYPHSWSGYAHVLSEGLRTPYHYWASTLMPYKTHQTVQYYEPSEEPKQHNQDVMYHREHQVADMEPIQQFQDRVTAQRHDSVENDIERQHLEGQRTYEPSVFGLRSEDFETRHQKFIEEHNEQDIENEIARHHHWVLQLHRQQELVHQRKQHTEAQQILVQHQGIPDQVRHLEQVHHQLQMQEYHLIKEQLVHHLAILKLQEALVYRQGVASEHNHEEVVHVNTQPYWQKFWQAY